jgi:hypothetical protein
LRESGKQLSKSVREFSQDIAQGQLVNAIRGRRTSNLLAYENALIAARKGDRIAQLLLPFHRMVLSINEEDASEVLVRLINRGSGLDDGETDSH